MKTQHTRSQKRILNFLQSVNRAISAQDIYVELRSQNQGMSLATVYRALEALKREGALQVRMLPNGESLYSSVHQDKHHLTCLKCGKSISLDKCPVQELETQLHNSYKFKIFYHTLEFFGLCSQCEAAEVSNDTEDQ
ncbi:Fur family transcriptional regulator [Aerosakkonemataceae cyanobacterium BLCC-F154]|uniref:Fur family transcriptional regulator n=1 Tax=Floridaenema fluviatile BLCC-F154 TaxID=3153640 RepID=A0ABV4YHN4_9CYAN